jgi:hypothetical protein
MTLEEKLKIHLIKNIDEIKNNINYYIDLSKDKNKNKKYWIEYVIKNLSE